MDSSIRYKTIIKSFFNIYNNSLPVLPDSTKYYQEVKKLIKNKSKLYMAVCVKGSKNLPHIRNIENFRKVILLIGKYFSYDNSFDLVGSKENFDYSQIIKM
jgi:heptosyltransferase-2